MHMRPLGHRILIQPDAQATETDGGLILPESRYHVPITGTVAAVGNGPARDQKIRAAAITRCLCLIDELAEMGVKDPLEYRRELERYKLTIERFEPAITTGMRVVYPVETGQTVTEDGVEYVLINEDDVVIIADEHEAAA